MPCLTRKRGMALIKRWSKIWPINSFEEVLKTKSLRILDGGLIFMVFSICWNPQGTVTVFNVVFILFRKCKCKLYWRRGWYRLNIAHWLENILDRIREWSEMIWVIWNNGSEYWIRRMRNGQHRKSTRLTILPIWLTQSIICFSSFPLFKYFHLI